MSRSRNIALGVSALVHGAAIAGLVLLADGRSGAEFKAPPTIELMLPPMAAAAASAVQPQQAEEVLADDAVDAEDVREMVEAIEPDPVPLPVMEEAVEAVDTPVVVAKAAEPEKPKPKPEKPKPRAEKPRKPKPRPETPKPQTPQDEAVTAPAATESVPSEAPPKAVASVASAGVASVAGGGRPGAKADYGMAVSAWIERHKYYPERLRSRNITGMPAVTFVLDRNGNVLDCWVEKSSGREALDKAAMRTIHRANPFPPPPPELAALKFTVPIAFQLSN